jgi:hypothetical protein
MRRTLAIFNRRQSRFKENNGSNLVWSSHYLLRKDRSAGPGHPVGRFLGLAACGLEGLTGSSRVLKERKGLTQSREEWLGGRSDVSGVYFGYGP